MPLHPAKRSFLVALLVIATLQTVSIDLAHGTALESQLPAQPLSDALIQLANELDAHLMYSTELTEGLISQSVPAGLSLEEALHALLDDTHITFDLIDGRIVVLRAKQQSMIPSDPEDYAWPDEAGAVAHTRPLTQIEIKAGTLIPNVEPVGARPIMIDRDRIDRSGYATFAEVIRALPQNYGGGPSEDTWGVGQEEIYNASRGIGLNLRGLGSGSTLILINGRRLAAGGGDGRFVDVSGIPLAAIERIAVLPDGASAIYGADAVGGVVNIDLRRNFEGGESQVKVGRATAGTPHQLQLAQTYGHTWDTGNVLLSAELYERSHLPAAHRAQSRDSDLRPFGGYNFNIPEGNPGNILTTSGTWAIPSGQDGRELESTDLLSGPNLYNRNEDIDLLPAHRRRSLIGTFNQDIGDSARLFADVLLSERDTQVVLPPPRMTLTVPRRNPFYVAPPGDDTGTVLVSYSFGPDFGQEVDRAKVTMRSATGGITLPLGRWIVTPAISYSSSRDSVLGGPMVDPAALSEALADPDPEFAFNPFSDGSYTNPATLAKIRTNIVLERQTQLRTINVAASGTPCRWFGRDVQVALGIDARHEDLLSIGNQGSVSTANLRAHRKVYAGYGEVQVPLIPERFDILGLDTIRVSLASRYERYSDFGGSSLPRVGLSWSPMKGLGLRGTWSKSFKAPNLVERDESRNFSALSLLADAQAPSGFSQALLWFGNSTNLHEERATTWTLGADIKVPEVDLVFELTYFNLHYQDRVDRVDFSPFILGDPLFADLVTRNPSPAQRAEVCSRARFMGLPDDCLTARADALIDMRLGNVASLRTSGIDISAGYNVQNRLGNFKADLSATYVVDFSRARYYTSPLMSLLDTGGNPIRFRSKAGVLWERGPLDVIGALSYAGAYVDTVSIPSRRVKRWTTLDAGVRYRLDEDVNPLGKGITLDLSAYNIFNNLPPFFNNPMGVAYDPENADLLGRFVSVGVRKEW